MSVVTTGRRGGLARVSPLPRPWADDEEGGPAGVSQPAGWPGGQWAGPEQEPRWTWPAGEAQPLGSNRHGAGQPRAVAPPRVTGYRQVREFRQVREVRVAHEVRVAATGRARTAPVGRTAVSMPGRTARRPAGRGGVRLTRRGRMLVTALLVMATLLVMALVWLALAARAQATDGGPPPGSVYRNLTSVVVHPGQSLWSVASEAVPSADPRAVMQEIVDLNALHGTNLVPGQRLWVPRG
jgi:hypothetical protein